MAYYVIITRQKDQSIQDCGITPDEWADIVHNESSLQFVNDERSKWHVAEHTSNGDGLWLDWGGIHCEHPKEETIGMMIGIAKKIDAHLFDTDGFIEPEWYGKRWWIDDERAALHLFKNFRGRFGREPRSVREAMKFHERQQNEWADQAPDWIEIVETKKKPWWRWW